MPAQKSGDIFDKKGSARKRVLLRCYDCNNLGDDLFIKIITDRYDADFVVVTKTNNKMLFSISNLRTYKIPRAIYKLIQLFGIVSGRAWLVGSIASRKVDMLVYVGGSIFMDQGSAMGNKRWALEKKFYARELHCPYYILGANYGPEKSLEFRENIRHIVAGAEDVCFRDEKSLEPFRDIKKARSAADMVFSMSIGAATPKGNAIRKKAIVSVMNFAERLPAEVSTAYDVVIKDISMRLVEQGYDVTLMSFCKQEGDEKAIKRIKLTIPNNIKDHISTYYYSGDIDEALSIFMQSDVVVGTRFHSVVLGLLFRKKVLPIVYSNKTTNMLDDIHFSGPRLNIKSIATFEREYIDFDKLDPCDIDECVARAQMQFSVLDTVINKKGANILSREKVERC